MRISRFALAVMAPAALGLAACGGGSDSAGAGPGLKAEDRVLGDPDAPVTVIEYASITCSHCKAWHDTVWDEFEETLVETGKVRFIFREFPTPPQDIAMAGFLIARCVPEERYFNVIETLFDRQQRLYTSQDRRGELLAVARAAGLDEAEFNACIRDEGEIDRINDWVTEAYEKFGVSSTPTFIVNGDVLVGSQPLSVFQEAVADVTGEPVPPASDAAEGEG